MTKDEIITLQNIRAKCKASACKWKQSGDLHLNQEGDLLPRGILNNCLLHHVNMQGKMPTNYHYNFDLFDEGGAKQGWAVISTSCQTGHFDIPGLTVTSEVELSEDEFPTSIPKNLAAILRREENIRR